MKKGAIYTRLSVNEDTNNKSESDSLEIQEKLCRDKASRLGIDINEDFVVSENWSGKDWDLDNRIGLKKIIDGARDGEYDTLFVRDATRITRSESVAPYLTFLHDMEKVFGVNVEFAIGSREASQHREIIDMLEGWSSGKYVQDFIRNTRKAKDELAYKNRIPHGTNVGCFGFDTHKADDPNEALRHRRTINDKEAEVVRIIFKMVSQKHSGQSVADYLNARGYKTKTGKDWNTTLVRKIIRNEVYYGELIWRKRKYLGTNKNRKIVMNPESERIIIDVPAIVPKRLWNKANKQLDSRVRQRTNQAYLLTGFMSCVNCGSPMSGGIHRGRPRKDGTRNSYVYYKCRGKYGEGSDSERCTSRVIKLDVVEELIFNFLKKLTSDPNVFLKKYEKEILKQLPSLEDDQKVINEELNKINNEKIELLKLKTRGHVEVDEYEKLFKDISERKSQIELKLSDVEIEMDTVDSVARAGAQIEKWMFEFTNYEFDKLPDVERIELLNAIGLEIYIETLEDGEFDITVKTHVGYENLSENEKIKFSKLDSNTKINENVLSPLDKHWHDNMQKSLISF